jgi:hypothetical protein
VIIGAMISIILMSISIVYTLIHLLYRRQIVLRYYFFDNQFIEVAASMGSIYTRKWDLSKDYVVFTDPSLNSSESWLSIRMPIGFYLLEKSEDTLIKQHLFLIIFPKKDNTELDTLVKQLNQKLGKREVVDRFDSN